MDTQPSISENSGFTLSELFIVLFIIGVCVAVGIPNFLRYNAKAHLNGAARQVMADLIAARMEAIKQNCNVIISFEDQYRYYMVVDKNGNNSYDVEEVKTIKDIAENYPGVKNIKTDTKNIFNAKGAMRRMRNIELQHGSDNVTIRISISGRIKIE